MNTSSRQSVDSPIDGGALQNYLAIFVAVVVSLMVGFLIHSFLNKSPYVEFAGSNDVGEIKRIIKQLDKEDIEYQLDNLTGKVYVREDYLFDARLALANGDAEINPGSSSGDKSKSSAIASDSIDGNINSEKDTAALSPTQKLEKELARTIASLSNVVSSRVHLAIPDSKNQQEVRASVVLRLSSNRQISKGQVSAISHLVASSVPGLSLENVTVIDHNGRLLKSKNRIEASIAPDSQLDYLKKLEAAYVERIKNLLSPILGEKFVKAQVNIELDVSSISAEQVNEQLNLTATQRAIRNTQLNDLTASQIKKLSVAVIVDNKRMLIDDNVYKRVPRNPEEMQRINELVKKAVGFTPGRGDSMEVVNVPFTENEVQNSDADASTGMNEYLIAVIRYLLVLLAIVGVFWLVFRLTRNLISTFIPLNNINTKLKKDSFATENISEDKSGEGVAGSFANSYYTTITDVQNIIEKDPKLVAQVIRSWVQEDEQRA